MQYSPAVLATELDGTMIPLTGNDQNARDLMTLKNRVDQYAMQLVFVAGRHLDIGECCDQTVSTSLRPIGWSLTLGRLSTEKQTIPIPIFGIMLSIMRNLRKQESEKQGTYKLSFYSTAHKLPRMREKIETVAGQLGIPVHIVTSIDSFNGDGLIDILPFAVSKAFAYSLVDRRWNIALKPPYLPGTQETTWRCSNLEFGPS